MRLAKLGGLNPLSKEPKKKKNYRGTTQLENEQTRWAEPLIKRAEKRIICEIKERVGEKNLQVERKKMLSMDGKEILIKAIIQVIPTYAMSCFQVPKGLYEDLERMERNFWWGQRDQKAKMAWVS